MRKPQFIKIIQDPENEEWAHEMRQEAGIQGVQEYLLHVYSLPRWKRIKYVVSVLCAKQHMQEDESIKSTVEKGNEA